MNCATDPQSCAVRGQIFLLLVVGVLCIGGCALSDSPAAANKAGQMSKVAPELIRLYDEYSSYVASGKRGVFKPSSSLAQIIDDRVIVDAVASGDANVLKSDLDALGMRQSVAFGRVVSGQLPILAIRSMATLPSLNSAKAASAVMRGYPRSLPPGTPNR